tara:strand:+ start:1385 stop:2377 length:993 start_codon:yes stop_codon:yes gene_type:complete
MKIGINGFGRIGRAVFKICLERGIDVVAINDLHGAEDAAYLLKYDSVYGRYNKKVSSGGDRLIVGGKKIKILNNMEPSKLGWKKLGVDLVVESTGQFTSIKDASAHIKAGAKRVVISAPCKGPGKMIVLGVNDDLLKKDDKVVSVASCTTNCLAPISKVLDETFGIKSAFMTTDHAYTGTQSLIDGSHRDRRRGRSAALNIIPTSTGANKAVESVLPNLKGKLKGISMRVPVANGSIVDLVVQTKKKTTRAAVNSALRKAANGKMKGIVEYSEDELVSSDVIGNPSSAVVDSLSTETNGDLIKVLAWYDNEYGYSNRLVDIIQKIEKLGV